MEEITRSVRDFVLPLERSGSLDASLSFQLEEDAAAQGTRLHIKVQKRLKGEYPDLQSERTVLWTFQRPDFQCLLRGRMDVFIPGDRPVMEEIKTTFQPQGLLRALDADPQHPFAQQVRMYAWILAQREERVPACRLRVISLLDERETLVEVPFDLEAFSAWVEAQMDGLRAQHLQALARAAERKLIGAGLRFPFEAPRPGQERLLALVEEALGAGSRLLVQAPTGLGKTAAVLYPGLRKALEEDLRVFYLTPRNSQHSVAEAFLGRLCRAGHLLRSITLRAKERICPQEELHCHPDVCPRASGYYDRLKESKALERLMELGCVESATLQALAEECTLCPFELSLDAARNADVIIGDYNYALAPSATLARFFGDEASQGRNLLLLDEAHNLPNRATDWFSPALDTDQLRALKKGWKGKGRGLKGSFTRQLERCLRLLETHAGPHRQLDVDPTLFNAEEQRLRKLLAKAASDGQELAPSHPLVQLFRQWSEFCGVLRERSEAHLLTWMPPGRLQITCVDASPYLAERFRSLAGAVLFSGTLKPFAYYQRLCGLAQARCEEIPSPFPPEHRCLLVVPQISTLYRQREQQTPRVAEFLSKVLPLRKGNYLVFFPSFEFLDKTRPFLDLPGFRILAQPRRASQDALQEILGALETERGLVVLAVQGGSLSEGVDLPGEALIGSIIVGPPIPPFDLERKLTKAYFGRALDTAPGSQASPPASTGAVAGLRQDAARGAKGGLRDPREQAVPPASTGAVAGLRQDAARGAKGGLRDRREQAVPPASTGAAAGLRQDAARGAKGGLRDPREQAVPPASTAEAFTYIYPAMAKAIQAAGRVIRGPEERGLLVFLDGRFLEPAFAQCFPGDWFIQSPREVVSEAILADVARFWEHTPGTEEPPAPR